MRVIFVIGLAAGVLGACASASEGQRQAAILQCQSVGISLSDPQFDVCTRAYALQANQDNLEVQYRRALNPTYEKRGLAHQWHGY